MTFKEILRNGVKTFEDLEKWLIGRKAKVDPRLRDVIAKYPMRVNTYYLSLIQKINDGIWKLRWMKILPFCSEKGLFPSSCRCQSWPINSFVRNWL